MENLLVEFFQWMGAIIGVEKIQVTYIGVLRSALALIFFTYIGYKDLQNRYVKRYTKKITEKIQIQLTWHPLLIIGLGLLLWEITTDYTSLTPRIGLNILLATTLGIGLHKIHKLPGLSERWRLFGAADMKAFVLLGILMPKYPLAGIFPLVRSPPHILRLFTLGVIQWTAIAGTLYIIGFGIFTIYKSYSSGAGLKFPESLIGYQTTPEQLHKNTNRKVMHEHGKLTFNGLDAEMVKDYINWRQNTNDTNNHIKNITDINKIYLEKFLKQTEWGPKSEKIKNNTEIQKQIKKGEQHIKNISNAESIWVLHDIPFLTLLSIGVWLTTLIGDPLYTLLILLS